MFFLKHSSCRQRITNLLTCAGVAVNGDNPCDLQVHDERLYARVLRCGSLGLGEAYMDGWWDCRRLDELFCKILAAGLDRRVGGLTGAVLAVWAMICNRQKISRAFQVGERHYDIGNDLYRAMLDKRMIYSCAYWQDATDLDTAQENKLDLIRKKLDLRPGMKVLDIGCGWGGTARFLAQSCQVEVTGITVSKEQAEYATKQAHGLPVTIRLMDYRNISEQFDRVLSIGMFEHVGYKNYRTFMRTVRRCLKDNGLFLLHTIGSNISSRAIDPWIDRYIFPNSMLPSASQIATALEGFFVLEDWHNFGVDYDKTLLAWFENFDRHWQGPLAEKYGERFYRMWKYYLLACAGSFRARKNQVWQLVLSKDGIAGGYCSPWRCGAVAEEQQTAR